MVERFPASQIPELESDEDAQSYAKQGKAPNTRKAYLSDWKDFEMFCAKRNFL